MVAFLVVLYYEFPYLAVAEEGDIAVGDSLYLCFHNAAEKSGDAAGMKKANDRANAIRIQAASYTAGSDGSKYNRVKLPYEENRPTKKSSSYEREKKRIYDLITSYGKFKYDENNFFKFIGE